MTSKPVAVTAVLQDYLVPVSCGWKSDSWQAGNALLVASTAFVFYTLSKLLAAHAADAVVEELVRLASSPLEAAVLAVVGLCLLAYGTGYSRILQLLTASQLKVVGVLLTISRSSVAAVDVCAAQGATDAYEAGQCASDSPRRTLERTSSGGSSSSGGSPRKELASHRLNERRGRLALHKHRWSFDVAPSSGPREEVPRQQRGSPTKPSSPLAVPRHEKPGAASPPAVARRPSLDSFSRAASCPVAPSGPPAVALARSGSRGLRRRREPTMQRIPSDQQLADLAAARRRSLENTCQRLPVPAQPPTATDSLKNPAGYQPLSTVAQEPGTHSPVQQPARSRRAVRFVPQQAPGVVGAAVPQPAPGTLLPSELSPAKSTWLYSRTLASLSSWAATVDSYVRPLLPASASSSSAAAGPAASAMPLLRSQSVPVPGSSGVKERDTIGGAAERGARLPVSLRRHSGMDAGPGTYARGAVSADPARKAQLEQLAAAARSAGTAAGASPAASQAAGPQDPTCPQLVVNQPDLGASAARSAVASVGLDGDCAKAIREVVTDEDLVQFGVVLGEDASYKASAILGLPEPWGSEQSLFGPFDGAANRADDWEQIVVESKPGLLYRAWRKPLRKGLYVYRSSTTIVGVSPREVRAFHLDDGLRSLWDETVIEIERVLPPASSGPSSQSSESCLHRFQTRFPRPMAARVYGYARRVWHRPSDGGCYMVCRSASLPPASTGTRAVHVTDYISCAAVRAAEGGTELVSVYFDDAQVRPGLAKMAVPKGLWPFILKYEAALRACLDQPPTPSRRSSLDGRQAATGAVGPTDEATLTGPPGGRRLGLAAWRARRGSSGFRAAQGPAGGKKLLRNVVLATGVKLMFDIMAQRR